MDTIFMNSENSRTSYSNRLLINLSDKIHCKEVDKCCSIKFDIYYTRRNIKKLHKNSIFKTSGPTCIKKFELPDGSYSISDIQDHFEYMIKKHETVTHNPPVRIQNMFIIIRHYCAFQ